MCLNKDLEFDSRKSEAVQGILKPARIHLEYSQSALQQTIEGYKAVESVVEVIY
jgi:hypothetical protein